MKTKVQLKVLLIQINMLLDAESEAAFAAENHDSRFHAVDLHEGDRTGGVRWQPELVIGHVQDLRDVAAE